MENENLTDEQLVQLIMDGKSDYYRELVIRHQARVFAVAMKVANHPKDAEDITQEVFIQVYRSLSNFRGESTFSTWIYRITMNKALDLKRKQVKLPVLQPDVPIDIPTDYTPESTLLEKEERELIRRHLDSLPPNQREVVELYYFKQQSYSEIADRLQIAIKTVESRLYRAKQLMRQQNPTAFQPPIRTNFKKEVEIVASGTSSNRPTIVKVTPETRLFHSNQTRFEKGEYL